MEDTYCFHRFYKAHELYYKTALAEIRAGRKESHWIWFIFPQLKATGHSCNDVFYGIENAEEARLFYNDDYLGKNLREICNALLECESDNVMRVIGFADELKFRSSLTLFYIATGDKLFADILDKFYAGKQDELTVLLLTGH